MTFGKLIDILGIQESKDLKTYQTKIEWIKFYFTAWEMYAIYNDRKYDVVRYRNDGVFDGTLRFENDFINIDSNFDKLEIIIENYKRLFIDIFENKNFRINFKDAI